MFTSQFHLTSKGPLGAIWVAAYFQKKLKKAQINETDISFSVDKILRDEIDVVTYRVLSYLLIGVVRIYSKKVTYLFDDCCEVLSNINEFLVSKTDIAQRDTLRAPYYFITLPDRFELDAFDLDIFEDVSDGHVKSPEEITLKDNAWKNEGMEQYFLDKYHFEEAAASYNTRFTDDPPAKDIGTSHGMDIDMVEVSTSYDFRNLEESPKKLQEHIFTQEECSNLETFSGVREEPPGLVESILEEHLNNGEQMNVPMVPELEKEIVRETGLEKLQDNTLCQDECENLEAFHGVEEEPQDHSKPLGEDDQTDREERKVSEIEQSDEMCQVNEGDHDISNLPESMEKPRDTVFFHEKCMDLEIFCKAKEGPPELVREFVEEQHTDAHESKFMEATVSENKSCQLDTTSERPVSITLDATPPSKFLNASGASSLEFMGVSTPATKDRARAQVLRKRKCLFDDLIVLPNEVLRQRIHNSTDLVSKRRKVQHGARAAWKSCQVFNFLQDFTEPLLPCVAPELRLLFGKNKLNVPASIETSNALVKFPEPVKSLGGPPKGFRESVGIINAPENYPESVEHLPPPETRRISVETVHAIEKLPDSVEPLEHPEMIRESGETEEALENKWKSVEIPEKLDISKSPTICRSLENTEIAPETPVQHSRSVRSFDSPKSIQSARVIPETSFGSIENDKYLHKDQELDLNLVKEEINLFEEDSQKLYGLSERTRMVARYLRKNFLNEKKQNREETLDLFRVLEGRTKKESARIFYEILVLKTTRYIDVEQDEAYGDIHVYHSQNGTELVELEIDKFVEYQKLKVPDGIPMYLQM